LSILLAAPALWAQTGAQVATFHSPVDNSEQPYALYVPRSFDPARKYPLVVSLHSEDTNHRINLRQVFGLSIRSGETNPEDLRFFPVARDPGFIVAAPFARGMMNYQGVAERDVYDMLADVERRFPVDPDRVYLTGVSMGGAGALRLALTRPDVWAGVAAVCPAILIGLDDLAPNALNLPVRLYHGEQDPIVPVANSRMWQRRLVDAGVAAEYIEYPGLRHDAWDLAYRGGAVFEWFDKLRRTRFPERVRFVAESYRYASAYWTHIDGLTPGTPATLDAKRTGAEIAVSTRNLDGFTLSLDRSAGIVTIDSVAVRVRPPSASLSFSRTGGKWRPGRFVPAGKRPGLEGPIADAVGGRQIYVYGTVGARTAAEVETRKHIAETAATWSSSRTRIPLTWPVKADTAVTADDLDSADVVLFGTVETNTLVARFAPQLPLALNAGAADYGLLFIAPVGKHYALVSSGLSWWTGADDASRGGSRNLPEHYRLLTTFGDYILFRGSLANVVAEGRFDSNWKVPAVEAAKMLATGTVTVH
jgi:poly(3-hydroxybutyrate) depolymerase